MYTQKPKRWRLVAGFLLAPFAAALFLSAFPVIFVGPPTRDAAASLTIVLLNLPRPTLVAYVMTLLIAVPVYWFLRDRVQPRLITIVLVGAGVATIPFFLLSAVRIGLLLEDVTLFALLALSGGLGGLVFWACVVWGDSNLQGQDRRPESAP